jgi:class 3 adenylate cyclase/predicted ATPase
VEDWLKSIGFGHLVEAFRAQGIEADQLGELTEDDLKEIGLNIGERRRFRRAVTERRDGEPRPGAASRTPTERRPLTMMFVDLVGSAALGELLEPEDLLEVIRRYRELCGAAIQRFGGSVARQVGDGTLAYFSYPMANENDPERAVRAALNIVRDIEQLVTPAPTPLQVRIGIATGRVIISDMQEGGTADLRSVVGSAPNLAARLQAVARAGGIIISKETHDRVRELFACEHLGSIEMRGFSEPRHAWRVLHDLPQRGWRPGARPQRLTPFCARRAELALLARHWAAATGGSGRAVLVAGEAGIGKSHLIETFLALNCLEDSRVVQLSASPFDVDSPLQPFAAWLHAEAGSAAAARAAGAPASDLAELLGMERAEAASLTPAKMRERTLAALAERVLALADPHPVCVVVEDLHWLDPSSLEVLERLVARVGQFRVMLMLSARDDFAAEWLAHAALSVLHLPRLRADDVAAMVQSLFEQSELPTSFVSHLVRKSDGVPLFVVELLRGLITPAGGAVNVAFPEDAEADIPASLHESLMARLDRAGLAREVAQVAAVIGRSVRPDLLAAVAERPAVELEQPLAALLAAGVMFRDSTGADAIYTFSHALLRDAAYDSLVRDQRQALHTRVAAMLRARDPDSIARQPEVLAHHLTEGGRAEEAAAHWCEAARRSLTRSALTEATRLLRRGLAALDKAPRSPALADARVRLMALLGPALIALKGPGSADAQDLYAQAFAVCQQLPENPAHFPIYWGWWRMSRDFTNKLDRAEALLGRARLRGDDGLLLQAHHCCWASHYCVGALDTSHAHALAGLAIYAAGDYRDHARLYGNHDAKVCAHGELAEVHWLQGRPSQALEQEQAALEWARELDHLGSTAHAMDYQLIHRALRRDLDEVFVRAGEMAIFSAEHGLADHHAKALVFRGWALALNEDPVAGLQLLDEGIARQRDIGTDEDFPIYLSMRAEALLRQDKAARAVAELQAARDEFARMGLQATLPELLRVLGEATLAADPGASHAAMALFVESAARGQAQGAAMLGLRTAVSAARLHLRLGTAEIGLAALVRAIAAVQEHDDGADLRAAAAMLALLRQRGVSVDAHW